MEKSLSAQLKKLTKHNHQQLEKLLVSHLRSISDRKEYIKLLQIFYGYFGALEVKIKRFINTANLPDFELRRKTESIAKDIKTLGATIPELADAQHLPEIKNQWQAFGALYVIEGSTLGGKVISQMLSKRLAAEDKDALTFFNGYKNKSEEMWASFKTILDSFSLDAVENETVIHAADDTFSKFKLWLEKKW